VGRRPIRDSPKGLTPQNILVPAKWLESHK